MDVYVYKGPIIHTSTGRVVKSNVELSTTAPSEKKAWSNLRYKANREISPVGMFYTIDTKRKLIKE